MSRGGGRRIKLDTANGLYCAGRKKPEVGSGNQEGFETVIVVPFAVKLKTLLEYQYNLKRGYFALANTCTQ